MRSDAPFSFGGQETESDKPAAPSAPKPSLRAKRSNPYSGAEHAASDSRRTGSCGLSMDCFALLAMTAPAALIPTALVYVATETNITRTSPRAKLLLARRPHRPAAVKPLRGPSASFRRLRRDRAVPMRQVCIHDRCCAAPGPSGLGWAATIMAAKGLSRAEGSRLAGAWPVNARALCE